MGHIKRDSIAILLDPKFWRSLFSEKQTCLACGDKKCGRGEYCGIKATKRPEWLVKQHKLIDHLANEGTIQSYFEEEL